MRSVSAQVADLRLRASDGHYRELLVLILCTKPRFCLRRFPCNFPFYEVTVNDRRTIDFWIMFRGLASLYCPHYKWQWHTNSFNILIFLYIFFSPPFTADRLGGWAVLRSTRNNDHPQLRGTKTSSCVKHPLPFPGGRS